MPFYQQFAFIFVDKLETPQQFVKTTGHELGHGAFGLEHPFASNSDIDEFTSNNLMDYPKVETQKKEKALRAYQLKYIENFK